jgi:hypothetical protein
MPLPYPCLAILLAAACGGAAPPPERAREAAAAVTQDTAFRGTTAPLRRAGRTAALLRAVRADSQPGYDRIVFEFAGDSIPGYHIEYASGPVVRCGSGDPVAVAGSGRLVVRFEPARAHNEQGNPTIAQRTLAPRLPAVGELQIVCDFEGQVEWVLGIHAGTPYRVLELTAPARLFLDVRHGRGEQP